MSTENTTLFVLGAGVCSFPGQPWHSHVSCQQEGANACDLWAEGPLASGRTFPEDVSLRWSSSCGKLAASCSQAVHALPLRPLGSQAPGISSGARETKVLHHQLGIPSCLLHPDAAKLRLKLCLRMALEKQTSRMVLTGSQPGAR